jgi:hypothetical protein
MPQQRKELRTLIEALGGGVLPSLEALDARELDTLTAAVREARRTQQRQLTQAMEAALGHLPALLRGPVRRILLP